VDLLVQIVHRIGMRAEQRVAIELVGEIHKVDEKSGLLFRIAKAALQNPDRTVRDALLPLVGEETFGALVQANTAPGSTLRQGIRTLIQRSNKGLAMSAICTAALRRGECLGAAERQPNGNRGALRPKTATADFC
jgi:hypothetical protein